MAMLRSYLIKSTYMWILDHGFTPYLLIDVKYQKTTLIDQNSIDENEQILLNISPKSIKNFIFSDEYIKFDTTFNKKIMSIQIPIESIVEIYSEETSQGMFFEFDHGIYINEFEKNNNKNINPHRNRKYYQENEYEKLRLI